MLHLSRARTGYVFLISVLTIGVIASATTVSMILLGLAAQQNGATILESAQAEEYAQTCAERALQFLRSDPWYIGEQTFQFAHGSCFIDSIGGSGNEGRKICTLGSSGSSHRRLEIRLSRLLPVTLIETWRETLTFSRCI